MRRALAKVHLRVAAVDDGAFTRRHRSAPIAAVIVSVPGTIEAVLLDRVEVDGNDATDRIAHLLKGSDHLEGVRAVLLDGVVVGGFNVIDLPALARRLNRPLVAVTRRRPDLPRLRAAIGKYFPQDAARRWRRLTARPLFRVPTAGAPIYAACVGCTRAEAIELVRRTTVRGFWPEPLKVAHLIASAAGTPGARRVRTNA